jgi:short-subunit dehydrogenase
LKNKRVLITGASKFMGRYLTRSLLEKNYELVLTYCNGKIDREFKNYSTQIKLDLAKERDLKKIQDFLCERSCGS